MITIEHHGFGHGVRDGDTHDITCTQCKQDLVYLRAYPEARDVYAAIVKLNGQGRTTNNSQIAGATGISRSRVASIVTMLRQRRYIKNVAGKNSNGRQIQAYHWRATGKPVPPVPNGEPGPAKLAAMFPMGGAR